MRGGARTNSGPAPDPNALVRERDEGEWTLLPAKGRGDAPMWPLPGLSDREEDLWLTLWAKPQALMWARNGQELEVAMLVRSLAEAEVPASSVNLRTLVRQMSDSLGLTTPGMRNNRWKIVADELPARRAAASTRPSSRNRLRMVDGVSV